MLICGFRGSPIKLAKVYCKSQHVSCALVQCDHVRICMHKNEINKIEEEEFYLKIETRSRSCLSQNFIPKKENNKIEKFGKSKSKLIKFGKCLRTNERTNSQAVSVNSHDVIYGIISLNRSISNWSVSLVLIRLLVVLTRSESVSGTDNGPSDTLLTSQSDAPPCARTRESQQHLRWGSQPCLWCDLLCLTTGLLTGLLTGLGCLGIPIICSWADIACVGLGCFGSAHSNIPISWVAHTTVLLDTAYSGDSNSPMPSLVGGILDTPIVTFHSRILKVLSLRISSYNTGLAVSAGSPGLRVYVDHSAPRSHSEIFNHDELSTEVVIDRLLAHELTCPIQIEMAISYHAVLFLICQVQIRHQQERKEVK